MLSIFLLNNGKRNKNRDLPPSLFLGSAIENITESSANWKELWQKSLYTTQLIIRKCCGNHYLTFKQLVGSSIDIIIHPFANDWEML